MIDFLGDRKPVEKSYLVMNGHKISIRKKTAMGKAFIVSSYLGSPQPERLAEYAVQPAQQLRQMVVDLCSWLPAHTYEDGLVNARLLLNLRVLKAMAVDYQAARKLLRPVSRDVRIVEQAD